MSTLFKTTLLLALCALAVGPAAAQTTGSSSSVIGREGGEEDEGSANPSRAAALRDEVDDLLFFFPEVYGCPNCRGNRPRQEGEEGSDEDDIPYPVWSPYVQSTDNLFQGRGSEEEDNILQPALSNFLSNTVGLRRFYKEYFLGKK
mmetsp:Transcript_31613/g.68374  ORF Transcript_31613/g.68374 Transcript_31613/m.68374 type:complete len:146 (+) Transcript_31613:60-497(+)